MLNIFLTGPTIWFYVGAVKSWLSPEPESIGNWHISPGLLQIIYMTVATWCALSLVCLNWTWIKHRSTAKQRAREAARSEAIRTFCAMRWRLAQLRELIFMEQYPYSRTTRPIRVRDETRLRIDRVIYELDALDIPHPPPLGREPDTRGLLQEWLERLNSLSVMVIHGDLDSARGK